MTTTIIIPALTPESPLTIALAAAIKRADAADAAAAKAGAAALTLTDPDDYLRACDALYPLREAAKAARAEVDRACAALRASRGTTVPS